MCGLGFVGLLIALFYAFVVITLLGYAAYRFSARLLKRLQDKKARVAGGRAEPYGHT
jgi:hypothetical protein